MKVTYLKRRAGKTYKAVQECRKTGAVLAVLGLEMKQFIHDVYKLPAHQVITHRQLENGVMNGDYREVIIDDCEFFIQAQVCNARIRRVTISKEFTKKERMKFGQI